VGKKTTLTIKDWSGKGRGGITIEVGGFMLIERSFGAKKLQKLVVSRQPDRFSSRFGMMAGLNKSNRTLSWGFTEMSLTIEDFSDTGAILSSQTYDFSGIAVADSRINGEDEELTFIFNRKSLFVISGVVVSGPS